MKQCSKNIFFKLIQHILCDNGGTEKLCVRWMGAGCSVNLGAGSVQTNVTQ